MIFDYVLCFMEPSPPFCPREAFCSSLQMDARRRRKRGRRGREMTNGWVRPTDPHPDPSNHCCRFSFAEEEQKEDWGGGPHADCTGKKGRGKDWHCGLREEEAGIDRQRGFTCGFLLSTLIIAVRVFVFLVNRIAVSYTPLLRFFWGTLKRKRSKKSVEGEFFLSFSRVSTAMNGLIP